jgi:type II secretory pathway pseudopilin PulG
MIRSPKTQGFTLIEVLVSAIILTAVMATLFSILSTLRKSAQFRKSNLVVTQAANFAFEQTMQSLKSGNIIESIWDPVLPPASACRMVRGFYIVENNQIKTDINTDNLDSAQKLVVISKRASTNGTFSYEKHEYAIGPNDPDASGAIYPTLIETIYRANPDPSYFGGLGFEWPVHLYANPTELCNSSNTTTLHWDQDPGHITVRKLTANNAKITKFGVRTITPQLNRGNLELINSPYITLEITAAHPTDTTVPTLSLRSTITPTFAYGDQRD